MFIWKLWKQSDIYYTRLDYGVLKIERTSPWNCGMVWFGLLPPKPIHKVLHLLPTQISMPGGRGHITSDLHAADFSPGQWQFRIKHPDCYPNLQITPLPLLTLLPAPETFTKRCQSPAGDLFTLSGDSWASPLRLHIWCFSFLLRTTRCLEKKVLWWASFLDSQKFQYSE